MNHHDFLTQLPATAKALLTEKSDPLGLAHLAGHLALIIGLGAMIAAGVAGWWLLLPIQGIVLIFLFTLEHECTHRTPFATPGLNDWVGRACGFLLLLPFEWFRYFHLAHHKWTNIPGQDPELDSEKPQTRAAWLLNASGVLYWSSMARTTLTLALGGGAAPYIPGPALPRAQTEARWVIAGYLAVILSLFVTPFLFWVWILPVILGQPFLRLYLLAEHGDCPRVANMFENTRTTFTTATIRFLAWNMPYHTEHHVYPNVPFHNLPRLHQMMRAHLKVTADGYVAFTKDYLARRP